MSTISTINVPFHGANLCIVNHDGNPYVPMKPIIEGMGLDWASQFTKLKKRFSKGIVEIAIPSKGGEQSMICLAMHKLTGWLYSIMPNKVKPEIRDKVIQYQEECDDVLYEYWTTGEVKAKQRKQVKQIAGRITSEQQEAIKQLVLNRGKALPKEKQAKAMITMWSSLKSHFGCTYKEIDSDKFTEALSLVARVPLEGEYLPKDDPRETTHLYVNKDRDIHNINALAKHYEAIYTAWKVEIYPALRSIDSPVAPRLYDRFKDGYSFLRMLQESLNGKHPVLIK
ncbi:phage antirepressor N-terminal domain-containing protein [Providencia stuartii]|uniref:phage antirepressor N-terminal domain-containing protein n=1 Tax=Providencia stuartii TaxID=588 RepID=UPI0034DDC1D9